MCLFLSECPPAAGMAPSQLRAECAAHTEEECVCVSATVWTSRLCVHSLCWLNFANKEQRALTAHTHSKKEPALLLAWFKSCSLIKLFKMCSWHFNTHFHFECDHILQRKAILKLPCSFRGLHEQSLRSLYVNWNHNFLQICCCIFSFFIRMSLFFPACKGKMPFNCFCKYTLVWLWI